MKGQCYFVEKCYFEQENNKRTKLNNISLQNSFNKMNLEGDTANFLYNKCLTQKNIYSL